MDGKYVETLKSLGYSYECSVATQSCAVGFVNWTAEQRQALHK
jgi:hypothetical protein